MSDTGRRQDLSIIYERLQSGAADTPRGQPVDPTTSTANSAIPASNQVPTPQATALRKKQDPLRQLTADKRKLERALDRLRGDLAKQTGRIRDLERQARAHKPMTPPEALAQATELDQWRARAAGLQQDIYSSTQLLELSKLEIDKMKKLHLALRDSVAEREAARLASLEACQALQAELAQTRAQHAAESASQRQQLDAIAKRLAVAEANRQPQWHLKLEDGTVLGPTDQEELYAWACDCRLGPDHLISRDRQTWIPARDLTALRMEWMVDLVDGSRYGPLNIFAMQHLLRDGSVQPDARLINARSNIVCKAADVTAPEILVMREEHKRAMAELAALRGALARAQLQIAQLQPPPTTPAPPKIVRAFIEKHRSPVL